MCFEAKRHMVTKYCPVNDSNDLKFLISMWSNISTFIVKYQQCNFILVSDKSNYVNTLEYETIKLKLN